MKGFFEKYTIAIGEREDSPFAHKNNNYQDGTTPMYRDVDGKLWAMSGHSHVGAINVFCGTCLDDMQKLYEQCVISKDRLHVSYVPMQHHEEGVFYMLASEEPFFSRSCQGNAPTRGRARLEANYDRFHMKITFLSETTPEDARAFVEALKIENKALGAAFIE
jgi:hypothetical protein